MEHPSAVAPVPKLCESERLSDPLWLCGEQEAVYMVGKAQARRQPVTKEGTRQYTNSVVEHPQRPGRVGAARCC